MSTVQARVTPENQTLCFVCDNCGAGVSSNEYGECGTCGEGVDMRPTSDYFPFNSHLPECCQYLSTDPLPKKLYAKYNAGGPEGKQGLNFQGAPCPKWEDLPDSVREKWEAVAVPIPDTSYRGGEKESGIHPHQTSDPVVPLCGLWTEHEEGPEWKNSPPVSSQISGLQAGCILASCTEGPSHWVLRFVGTYEECRERLGLFHQGVHWVIQE